VLYSPDSYRDELRALYDVMVAKRQTITFLTAANINIFIDFTAILKIIIHFILFAF